MTDPEVETPKRRFRGSRGPTGEERAPRRGLYLLPHLITTAGIFFGFYAIVQAFTGNPDFAAVGIILAIVCDTLDGRVARMAGSASRFGLEYDSIADTVSFGVAPAMLAFGAGNLNVLGRPGWVMAFLFTVCAALRLARFNISPGRYRGRFEGLPSPAAAGVVATTQLFASFVREHGLAWNAPEFTVAAGMAILGLLMVSPVPYRNFKEIDLRHSYRTLVIVVVAIVLVIQEPSVSLFALSLLYAVSGPIEWLWRLYTKQPLEEIAEPVSPEPQEGELDRMTS